MEFHHLVLKNESLNRLVEKLSGRQGGSIVACAIKSTEKLVLLCVMKMFFLRVVWQTSRLQILVCLPFPTQAFAEMFSYHCIF